MKRYILQGTQYLEFLRRFHVAVKPDSYFEIGVNKGKSIRHSSGVTVGVDPEFILEGNIMARKKCVHLFQMTSDDFFLEVNIRSLVPNGFKAAFLDGMHLFEFLLRDLINTEPFMQNEGIIFMHDCLPINIEMAERNRNPAIRKDLDYKSYWTGDVWKIIPILRKYRPELQITVLNCAPTGLVAVQGLNGGNQVLSEHYNKIVDEFLNKEIDDEVLRNLHHDKAIFNPEDFLSMIA